MTERGHRGAGIGAIRTRFAPQPTGKLAIASARTALFAWLFARRHGGTLEVRVHNVDRARSRRQDREGLAATLRWLGIHFDDGVRSLSDRRHAHIRIIDRLVRIGHAYTAENGVVYMRVPERGSISFDDPARGEITVSLADMSDFALKRRNGDPRYDLAVAVDDYDKCITHVFRGVDHLQIHTPRQVLIMQALGATPPVYTHLPEMITPAGKQIRTGGAPGESDATTLEDLRAADLCPDAVRDYLIEIGHALKGPLGPSEIQRVIDGFSPERLATGPIVFDEQELRRREAARARPASYEAFGGHG